MSQSAYLIAADGLLALHVLYVLFVVLGLVVTLLGGVMDWQWVRNRWFRSLHLCAIAVVVLQAWLGWTCPLTVWEMSLRALAGDATYSGAFIGHWLHRLLYYQAPAWVFIVAYTAFGALVAASWYWVRPGSLVRRVDNTR